MDKSIIDNEELMEWLNSGTPIIVSKHYVSTYNQNIMNTPQQNKWTIEDYRREWLKYKENQSGNYKLNVCKKIWAKFLKVSGIAKIVRK